MGFMDDGGLVCCAVCFGVPIAFGVAYASWSWWVAHETARSKARRQHSPDELAIVIAIAEPAMGRGSMEGAEAAVRKIREGRRAEFLGSAYLRAVDMHLSENGGLLTPGSRAAITRWATRLTPPMTDLAARLAAKFITNADAIDRLRTGTIAVPVPAGLMLTAGERLIWASAFEVWRGARVQHMVGTTTGASVNVGYGVRVGGAASSFSPVERKTLVSMGHSVVALSNYGLTVAGHDVLRIPYTQIVSSYVAAEGLVLQLNDHARPMLLLSLNEADAWMVNRLVKEIAAGG